MNISFLKLGIILWISIYLNHLGIAQIPSYPPPIKWSKVSAEELAIKECFFEKEAKGVVLCDYGKLMIYPDNPVTIKYHKRIKILKEEGLDLADISLSYYSKDNFEKISSVHAQTINTDANGSTVIKDVENKQIFDTKIDEYYNEIRFTFPDVKVGSILEYEYTLFTESRYFLEGWVFQDEIPTMYSEFTATISDKFVYDLLYNGPRLLEKYSNKPHAGNQWILTNLPSLKDEPFVWNNQDYAEKILFQLAAYQKYAGIVSEYKEVLGTWDGIATDILERESLINFLKKSDMITRVIENLNLSTKNNLEKVKAIYHFVNQNFSWDGIFRYTPSKTPKELFDSKNGSSADLNLLLLLLLKEAQIEAYPALISTKNHGLPMKKIAFLNQFNHLICVVNLDNQMLFLDARAAFHPYNLIEKMDLNQAAFVLDKENPRWVDISPPANNHRTVYIVHDLSKTEENEKQGSLTIKYEGYYAASQRKLLAEKGQENYIQSELNFDEIKLDKVQFKNIKDLEEPLVLESELYENFVLEEDMVYFNPIYLDFYKDNPFKADKRFFPIDLIHPDKDSYVLNLTIPANYEVQEMPKELQIRLPNNGGSYLFSARKTGNTLQIASRVTINKANFTVEEYPYLKEFFDQIREKHAEQIVFKKKV